MNKAIPVLLTLALAGCGIESAGTAATVAAMKAKEIKQGQENKDKVVKQLDEANRLAEQRMTETEKATENK